ncbi:MAG: proline iminopeptidase-family hydrolase [Parvularculaceae bacterium]
MPRIAPLITSVFLALTLAACNFSFSASKDENAGMRGDAYFDNTGRDDVLSGGVKMIPISTPAGDFRVWTKRVGNNPRVKVLLLHGGPAMTHEYFEAFDSYFPGAGVEYYYYDQLGSFYSDQPDDDDLWTTERFVDEVEQVRAALGLDETNFCLLGHSWGGILAMEYALAHQDKMKCLIISNMMASIPDYNQYAADILADRLDPDALAEIRALEAAEDFENPRYMELLIPEHYERHVLRMPFEDWPDPVVRALNHYNAHIYTLMQGPSEFGARGRLEHWDRTEDLKRIEIPTLAIGGRWDTMDPAHMKWMAGEVQNGRYLATEGSHMAIYDDQKTYMNGVIKFLKDVDAGKM